MSTPKLPVDVVIAVLTVLFLAVSCESTPERLRGKADLSSSYRLVNQDSQSVEYPGDMPGSFLVVGYIFTHCQNVCSAITANMKRIEEALRSDSTVHFVSISFDPQRDQPAVLRNYMNRFDLSADRFTFLTGDSSEVRRLLETVEVKAWKEPAGDTASTGDSYSFVHTNRIHLIDPQGRVRGSYRGSTVKPDQIKKDLAVLRE
jgi:protein SCO1/2